VNSAIRALGQAGSACGSAAMVVVISDMRRLLRSPPTVLNQLLQVNRN
jgi:hypothetical protein